jgi:hypothetical protein
MVSIHVRPSAIEKHKAAPLREERERFLVHRRALGMRRSNVRGLASALLHVVRLLNLDAPRQVTLLEIETAGELWAVDTEHHLYRKSRKNSKKVFVTAAKIFLRFHGLLDLQIPAQPFFAYGESQNWCSPNPRRRKPVVPCDWSRASPRLNSRCQCSE